MHRGFKAGVIAVFVAALAVSAANTNGCTDEDVQECESMCSASGLVVLNVACSDNLYDCRCGSSGMTLEDGNMVNDPIFEELEAEGAAIQAEIAAVFDIALDFGPDLLDDGRDGDGQLLRGSGDDFDTDSTLGLEGAIEDAFMMEAEEMLDETFSSSDQGGFAILSFIPVDEQENYDIDDDNLPIALPSFHLACMASFLSDFLLKALQPDGDFMLRDDDTLDGRSMPVSDRWSTYGDDYYYDLIYPEEESYYTENGDTSYIFWFPDDFSEDANYTFSDFFDVEVSFVDETTIRNIYISETQDEGIYLNGEQSQSDYRDEREKKASAWLIAAAAVSVGAAVIFSALCLMALVGCFDKTRNTRNVTLLVANSKESGEKAPLLKTAPIQVVPTSTKSGPEMVTSSVMVV